LNLLNKPSVTASAMYSLDENHESNAAYLDNISFLMQANQTLKDIYVPSSESTLLNSELIKISLIGYNATNESSPASFANFLLLQNTLLTPKVDFINNLTWADSLATAYMYDEKNIDNLFLKDLSKLIDNL
jgi:agmatine/peptidylarginine deiminase